MIPVRALAACCILSCQLALAQSAPQPGAIGGSTTASPGGAGSSAPAAAAPASVSAASPDARARPRIALVLSGGGARGFAHIGVLRVLKELRVPVDIVVGTSMGSVIGGAYAAGVSVEQLERMARETDWDSVVADRPARDDLAFRRREEDVLLPSRIEFGVNSKGVSLPPAAAGNAALEAALTRLLPPSERDKPVSQLPLPFRSVASDLLSGELVELAETPLFLTMRASLAVPGVFAPVRVNQRLVVDGGLVRNLPVDMARAMGADIVIAVNVGTPLAPESDLHSAFGVAQQMLQILTEQNVQRSLKELGPNDVLIAPDLTGVSFLDFDNYARAMKAGERAARRLAARLAPLALSERDYLAFDMRRLAAPVREDRALPLAQVEVKVEGRINPEILRAQADLVEGQPATMAQVRKAASTLYGRGDLAHVETEVQDQDGQRKVEIKATEAEWAGSRVRVGLELASDFADSNQFALKLMHVRTSLDDWGAELRTVARIGNERAFGMQFYQPLGAGAPWYLAPSFEYSSGDSDVFTDGRRTSRVASNLRSGSMVIGRELGEWGDLQFGLTRELADVRTAIPADPAAPIVHTADNTEFVRWRVDTLDSLAFPSRGLFIDAEWQRSPSNDAAQPSLARSDVIAMSALSVGDWAGHLYGEWARAQRGSAPLTLGGFLRLSGTPIESVAGRSVVLTRAVVARRIGALPSTLGGMVRLGFSAELGGGFDQDQPLRVGTLKKAGSAFVAVDTRFGPLYFGAGATHGESGTVYLFLGPIW